MNEPVIVGGAKERGQKRVTGQKVVKDKEIKVMDRENAAVLLDCFFFSFLAS